MSVKVGNDETSSRFLCCRTTHSQSTTTSTADSVEARKAATDGESSADNAAHGELELTPGEMEIHRLHVEACKVRKVQHKAGRGKRLPVNIAVSHHIGIGLPLEQLHELTVV